MATTTVARDAFDAFYSGDHTRCSQLLEQIGSFKGSVDHKATHNHLLNEYYKSGCADPQKLLTKLTQVYDRARERETKKGGKKNVKKDEEEEDTYREEEDMSILRYNQALLCLQLRQHAQAAIILEELFDNIEPIDDFLAIKICFSLLELCLTEREPEQAVAVLNYLEKPNAFLTVLRSEKNTKVAETRTDESADGEDGKKGDGDDGDEGDDTTPAAPELKGTAASARSTTADAPQDGETGSDAPLPSLYLGAFLPRHGRAPDTISRAEYRFFCLMYRARLGALLKNTKAAKKDVKFATEVLDQELRHAPILTHHAHTTGPLGSRGADVLRHALKNQYGAMIMVVKAYLEYCRQNPRKAMKLLAMCQFNFAETRSSNGAILTDDDQHGRTSKMKEKDEAKRRKNEEDDDGEDAVPTDFHPAQDEACKYVFFNNLGCIHFLMQKPTLATFYFQKALQGSPVNTVTQEDRLSNYLGGKVGLTLPGVLATKHWLDRRAEIAFNAGLQMLMSEKPKEAVTCFETCIPVFRHWPRLWLRIGECYIEMHRQAMLQAAGEAGDPPETDGVGPTGAAANASRHPRPGSRGSVDSIASAMGVGRQLPWTIQGAGKHRRWLLKTVRKPMVARRPLGETEEAGDAGGGAGLLSQAAMCMRNVLSLVAPSLPDRDRAAAAAATADASAEDGAGRGAPAASCPGSTRQQAREMLEAESSVLEDAALVKLAYVSLCQHDHASALRHTRRLLEKNLLLPQASQSEDFGDTGRTRWTLQIQNLPHPGRPSPVRCPSSAGCITDGVMYLTEALLLSGKAFEARALLGSFMAGDAAPRAIESQTSTFMELERVAGTHVVGPRYQARAAEPEATSDGHSACGGLSASTPMWGLTPPSHVLASAGTQAMQAMRERDGRGEGEKDKAHASAKESGTAVLAMYPPTEFPRLGDMQCMLYSNLASLHLQDGNLKEAERCCEKAFEASPNSLAPLRTLVYILLRRGKHTEALQRLKQGRAAPASRTAAADR